jgi:hypothetical protein
MKKLVFALVLLLLLGLGFRLFLALRWPTDEPDDGRLYARMALNILDHHSYSVEVAEPYAPTYIRMPGYPLFIAGCYLAFGRENNRAIRVTEAVLDTITCFLVGLLAFWWTPASWSRRQKRIALILGTALAVSCPFTAIYVATILTETCTILLITACALLGTLALASSTTRARVYLFAGSGLVGGLATLFRPDSGLFVGAVGLVLLATGLRDWQKQRADALFDAASAKDLAKRIIVPGIALSLGFAAALTPWTVRNARVFGVFQPIAPTRANMPEDFVAYGYIHWLKTWVDDVQYVGPFEWALDERQIKPENLPDSAFDSPEERERVAQLFERYNGKTQIAPPPKPAVTEDDDDDDDQEQEEPDDEDQAEEAESALQPDGMTPELDAEFGKLASERIARHPFRFYVVLPAKRAASMWFDTHSQYYPFQGSLFPTSKLDPDLHQQYWMPLFAFLTCAYTLLGVVGCGFLVGYRSSRRWFLLLMLLLLPRLVLLSALENPEPRYVVELFALVVAAGALPLSALLSKLARQKPMA